MPAVWFLVKRSLNCNPEPSDVHNPETSRRRNLGSKETKNPCKCSDGCLLPIPNLKDVIHRGTRHTETDVSKFKSRERFMDHICSINSSSVLPRRRTGTSAFESRQSVPSRPPQKNNSEPVATELPEGSFSRKVVEQIFWKNWLAPGHKGESIEKVFKVHNKSTSLDQFEDYRDIVKIKAGNFPNKHPGCLLDGNELLRFFGTTIQCSFGMNSSLKLCTLDSCGLCQILRHGFSATKSIRASNGMVGVLTCSTSKRACESIEYGYEGKQSGKKAVFICRVIAGRVLKPSEDQRKMGGRWSFDSVSKEVGEHSDDEELYLRSHRALLPCFIVILNTSSIKLFFR